MNDITKGQQRSVPAILVRQWLERWNEFEYEPRDHRSRPEPHFYLFSLPAVELRALCGIYPRTTADGQKRSDDLGIQRRLDKERSDKIRDFVQSGYPWSDLSETQRRSRKYDDLRKPGWLPTAIVVNILSEHQVRRGHAVASGDLVRINILNPGMASIQLPEHFSGADWKPKATPPMEVVDGQHRLWAFEADATDDEFALPVVAFYDLDISWQAYLFWSINITPKRINQSLAFDLYPLLRSEDWLERFEGPAVYRQTRAQELVEALWSHPASPWHLRINMLGEPGQSSVSQAAWIRALTSSFIRTFEGRGVRGVGGLYGAKAGKDDTVLPWTRAQQAAFLIFIWQRIEQAIRNISTPWAETLRKSHSQLGLWSGEEDAAFEGPNTLLNTDQGVRAVLLVTNDLFYIQQVTRKLDLESWSYRQEDSGGFSESAITEALDLLSGETAIVQFATEVACGLVEYDWRTANDLSLTDEQKSVKLAFRGSGGYRELRRQLLRLLSERSGDVAVAATQVLDVAGLR